MPPPVICAITETEDCRQASLPGGALNSRCALGQWCRDHCLVPPMMWEEDPHTLLVAAARGRLTLEGLEMPVHTAWADYFEARASDTGDGVTRRRLWLPRWHPDAWPAARRRNAT